jgi:P-type Cu+ transporter
MVVDPHGDGPRLEHGGRSFWFCSEHCLHRFQSDPGTYADETRRPDVATSPVQGEEAVEYTCPMHPEVRQLGPGSLSRCRFRSC